MRVKDVLIIQNFHSCVNCSFKSTDWHYMTTYGQMPAKQIFPGERRHFTSENWFLLSKRWHPVVKFDLGARKEHCEFMWRLMFFGLLSSALLKSKKLWIMRLCLMSLSKLSGFTALINTNEERVFHPHFYCPC